MIEQIEGIEKIERDEEPTLKLTPRNGEPKDIPGLKQNEEMVLECVKKGHKAFVEVLLETGFDKDLIDIEREVYETQKELTFLDIEIRLCVMQRELLIEYSDNFHITDNPKTLRHQLFANLVKLVEDNVHDAVDSDIKEQDTIKGQFRLLKIPEIDPLILKADYIQILQMHSISFENKKLSEIQKALNIKIDELRSEREEVSGSLDDARLIKREVDNVYFNFNQSQIQIFNREVSGQGTFKVPPLYCVNIRVMEQILMHKVSPNLTDPETGETLLHIALGHQHLEMVELLMTRGGDPLIVNRNGITPMKIASNLEDPRFLAVITAAMKKSDFLHDQLRASYIAGLKEFLKELPKAKEILDSYADTLVSRLGMFKIIRIILFIETRIDSRRQEFDIYYRKLKEACDLLDPTIFFTEVAKRAENAGRGLFHYSSLNDPLIKLLLEFMKHHNSTAFAKAKEALIIANAKEIGSPVIKRESKKIKQTKDENHELKVNMSLLLDEVKELRSEVKALKESSDKVSGNNTPRDLGNGVKMTTLPVRAYSPTKSTMFRP